MQNDGVSLSGLKSADYSFFYSYDAVVHFDLEIVMAYMPEFFRVLRPGGFALIHHSNYSENPGGDFFTQNPHCRNFMSAAIWKHIAMRAGFVVHSQTFIDWGYPESDCVSLMQRPA